MKKRIGIVCIICMLVLATFHVSMAAENTITLNPSKQKVKVDEEFTVTIKQTYGENCASIVGDLEYDSAFEFVKKELKEWNNLGTSDTKIAAIPESSGASESVLVYTFKAKSNITDGKITFKGIEVKILENGKLKTETIADQTVTVTVGDGATGENPNQTKTLTSMNITKKPSTTTYTEGSIFDPAGMEIVAVYSDGTSKVVTNYTYTPSEALKTSDKEVTITYVENGVTKTITQPITVNAVAGGQDNNQNNNNNNAQTTSNTQTPAQDTTTTNANKLPKTGTATILLAGSVLGLIAVGLVFYKRYQKYKDI